MKIILQNYFSALGRSFIPAVAVMSCYALLLSIGAVLKNPHFVNQWAVLQYSGVRFLADLLTQTGLVIINYLPLIFCISIAIGMTDKGKKETAALSALIAYLFMLVFSGLTLKLTGMALKPEIHIDAQNMLAVSPTLQMREAMQSYVLGIQTVDTGVLGGIIVGTLCASITRRNSERTLPLIFGFYQGRHLPPILCGLAGLALGLLIPFVWPWVGRMLTAAATALTGAGIAGSFIFGFVEKLLLPTGLQHVWYSLVHYTPIGGTLEINGQHFVGTKAITMAALATPDFTDNIHHITRLWLGQGDTPGKVFGIPGALVGIYLAAKDRSKVKTVAISAAIAAMFAGVVEPFTFMYLFVAPPLFLIDCTLQGLSFAILDALHVSYLGGSTVLEILFNGIMQGHKSTWIPIVVLGIALFFVYLLTFKWYIETFNVLTPGRETVSASATDAQGPEAVAREILQKLGGSNNIKTVNNCMTRLRITLHDPDRVDTPGMRTVTDAAGVAHPARHEYQIIFGLRVSHYRQALDRLLNANKDVHDDRAH
nr:PTS transporter subunit EIIC [uncultured Enterobacter sp.]